MIARRSPRTSRKTAKVAIQPQPESDDDSSPIPPPSSSKPKGKKPASTSSKGKHSSSKKASGGDVPAHGVHDDVKEDELQEGDDSFETPSDPSAELGLAALRDSPEGMKPFYPYSTLIRYAIKGSPERRMLLEDIYTAIEERFPWFKTAPTGWKNSIRHNLSLNPTFQKVPRPLTDRGKGAYWTVNDNVDPRSHRPRKKQTRGSPLDGAVPFGEGGNSMQFGRVVYPSFAFDPNAQIQIRFPTTGENIELALCPEVDEEGSPNWRSIWLNELIKLQHATAEAERNGQDADWYRAMIERLRVAFAPPVDDDDDDDDQVRQVMQATDEKGSDADGDGEGELE